MPGARPISRSTSLLLAFLLAPIAIVLVFALNPTPYISFPPVGVSLRWFEKFFAQRASS